MSEEKKEVKFDPCYTLRKPVQIGDRFIERVTVVEPPASKLSGVTLNLPASKTITQIEFNVDTAFDVVAACVQELNPVEVRMLKVGDLNALYFKCIELFFT